MTNDYITPLRNVAEVMKFTGNRSRGGIYGLIQGGLPYIKVGKNLRFNPASVQNYFHQRETAK